MRHARFIAFCVILAAAFLPGLAFLRPEEAFMGAFDLAALTFIGMSVPLWLQDRHDADRAAQSDDGGRVLLFLVALLAVLAVLLSVGLMIGQRTTLGGWGAAMIVVTLILAWFFANLVLAFHYAHVNAGRDEIAFPGTSTPSFSDYVYFSFVVGMTCQTADVTMASTRMRRIGTLHGTAAFFFNLGVLALSVNVLSGIL